MMVVFDLVTWLVLAWPGLVSRCPPYGPKQCSRGLKRAVRACMSFRNSQRFVFFLSFFFCFFLITRDRDAGGASLWWGGCCQKVVVWLRPASGIDWNNHNWFWWVMAPSIENLNRRTLFSKLFEKFQEKKNKFFNIFFLVVRQIETN